MSRTHVAIEAMLGMLVLACPSTAAANEKDPTALPPAPQGRPIAGSSPTRPQEPRAPEPAPVPTVRLEEPTPPPPLDTRPSIDAMLGIGSEHLSLGLGLRGGKTFHNRFYVGGLGVYHIGSRSGYSGPYGGSSSSASAFYLGPEVGYAFQVPPFILRPYLGIGVASVRASAMSGGVTVNASTTELGLWPGLLGRYQLSNPAYFVGADFRIVTGPWGSSIGLFATGGMHFGS
jgi:hypothetical protein